MMYSWKPCTAEVLGERDWVSTRCCLPGSRLLGYVLLCSMDMQVGKLLFAMQEHKEKEKKLV